MRLAPCRFAVLPVLVLAALPRIASAQPVVDWNRKMLDVSTVPSAGGPAGTFDILVSWTFDFDGEGLVGDLSTDANVTWGPAPARGALRGGEDCLIWDIKDGCVGVCASGSGGPCGDVAIDGLPAALTCDSGSGRCAGPVLNGTVTGAGLTPGDEITVILYPSPGAVPDGDTSDDSLTIAFGVTAAPGDPVVSSWSRVKARYR